MANLVKNGEGNFIIGKPKRMNNTKIIFDENSKNNVVYFEPDAMIRDSTIKFYGDNSLVYIGNQYNHVNIAHYTLPNTVLHIGKNTAMNGCMKFYMFEGKMIYIGNNTMSSYGICIKNADPHLIYDIETRKRVNPPKSTFIGDHVWIGQDVTMIKGCKIHSGSIIGACTFVPAKEFDSNVVIAGTPGKVLARNRLWDRHIPIDDEEEMKFDSVQDDMNKWIFDFDESQYVDFDELESKVLSLPTAMERAKFLHEFDLETEHNYCRFASRTR